VTAVLHAVAEFVEGLRRQRGLQRYGPDVVPQAEWIRPANIRYGQTPFACLPVMPVIPAKGYLLFRRDKVIEPGSWEVGEVVILCIPRVSVTVKVGTCNLGGILRNLVIDAED